MLGGVDISELQLKDWKANNDEGMHWPIEMLCVFISLPVKDPQLAGAIALKVWSLDLQPRHHL